ncbi:MAG: ABC transporter ATP-binding protein [Deltaproteobacteria bacterium]|nr:ABC transporter ATP-binding protein [Deltaproteobacteria bacterium]
MTGPVLSITDLSVVFPTEEGLLTAVAGASLKVNRNEVLGLVGESGCGKSVTALSAVRLLPRPGRINGGQIHFSGRDMLALSENELMAVRGKDITMIFQDPMTALSPLVSVGAQMAECFLLHEKISKKDAIQKCIPWLSRMGLPEPVRILESFPYALSGGQQQRIMIAMALMMEPSLVIADEPTTALDATVSAQIFDLLRRMRGENSSVLLITHDLGVVWELCDRVIVMYAGKIVEEARVNELFARPLHPYTEGLLRSVPVLGENEGELFSIEGQVPSPLSMPVGCRFSDRCHLAFDRCRTEEPELLPVGGGGWKAACFLAAERLSK